LGQAGGGLYHFDGAIIGLEEYCKLAMVGGLGTPSAKAYGVGR